MPINTACEDFNSRCSNPKDCPYYAECLPRQTMRLADAIEKVRNQPKDLRFKERSEEAAMRAVTYLRLAASTIEENAL